MSASAKQRRAEVLRDTRRSLIVEAARGVFAREGLDATSMRMIATEAGCTTGAIYPYFDAKETLYAAVLEDSLDALYDHMTEAVPDSKAPPERLRAAIRAFFGFYQANPQDLWLGLYLFRGITPSGLSKDLDRVLNRKLGKVFALLQARFDETGAADPAIQAAQAVSTVTGALVMGQTKRLRLFNTNPKSVIEAYLATL